MNKPTALITGASSGFGAEFCKLFAADGHDLVITSRHDEDLTTQAAELEKAYGVKVWHFPQDLSKPGSATKLFEWTQKQKINVSILVNNAGIGLFGHFADHKLEQEQALLQLNMTSLTELCHLYIPQMKQHGGGKILNIASIAAFQAGPLYATYFASKGYVLLFSEALHEEYAKDNIVVSTLCPGVSKTQFFKNAAMPEDSALLQGYLMTAEQVAEAGYAGLQANKRVIVPGFRNKLVALGYRILPRATITHIAYKLISKTGRHTPQ
jgi:uncharacterized protein